MPHIADPQGILHQNLLDAGCGEELTERLEGLLYQGEEKAVLDILAKHRKRLLDCCHAEQKKLDCLDYLVYRMEKETHMK